MGPNPPDGSEDLWLQEQVPYVFRFNVGGGMYWYTYYGDRHDDDGFYSPHGAAGNQDVFFHFDGGRMRASIDPMYAQTPVRYLDEFFPAGDWVLPYNLAYACGVDPSNCYHGEARNWDVFLTPGRPHPSFPSVTAPVSYTFAAEADVVVGAESSYEWAEQGLRLKFPQGRRLVVEGDLTAEGVTFTESAAGQGWGGVYFTPGSGGTIENSVVERVRSYGGTSVHIADASPTFRNSFIRNDAGYVTGGFYVTGFAAKPVLEENIIEDLSGHGVVARGGAEVRLIQSTIRNTGRNGLVAYESGTDVFLSPPYGSTPGPGSFGNRIQSNGDYGVYAYSGAYATLGWYYYGGSGFHNDGFNTVSGNADGGLVATYSGTVAAGNTSNNRKNRLFSNGSSDARASGTAARVWASCDWWNDPSPPFRVTETDGGIVDASYYLLEDPYVNPNAACVGEETSILRDGTLQAVSADGAYAGASGGGDAASPRGLLIAAAEASHKHPAAALALLRRVIEQGPESPLAPAALAEIGQLLSRENVPASVRSEASRVLNAAATDAHAPMRSGALRALVLAQQAKGDADGALEAAAGLVEGAVDPEDIAFGHLSQVYLHANAGREAEAWAALELFEKLRAGSLEAELARQDLEAVGLEGRRESGERMAPIAASSAAPRGVTGTGAGGGFSLGPVYPNPLRGAAVVSFELERAADVRIVVYDVLGREVATLVEAPFAAGSHSVPFEASALPSGAYVVRFVAGRAAATRPITVLR